MDIKISDVAYKPPEAFLPVNDDPAKNAPKHDETPLGKNTTDQFKEEFDDDPFGCLDCGDRTHSGKCWYDVWYKRLWVDLKYLLFVRWRNAWLNYKYYKRGGSYK